MDLKPEKKMTPVTRSGREVASRHGFALRSEKAKKLDVMSDQDDSTPHDLCPVQEVVSPLCKEVESILTFMS